MVTRLTIDRGNSAVKVGLWYDNRMVGSVTCIDMNLRDTIEKLCRANKVDSAIVCSVVKDESNLLTEILHNVSVANVFVLDSQSRVPISIQYDSPSTLGADRIAAVTGATVISPGRNCLVVDSGTAITYDFVKSDKTFLGGNIAPGMKMRAESLSLNTSCLPLIELEGDTPFCGYDTETAIRAGVVRGVVAELIYYYNYIIDTLKEVKCGDVNVVLTGGTAHLLTPFLNIPVAYEPNLVMIGLKRILEYNEAN